ncbi:MAG: PA14 domain-containing protein [Pseudomonadota bacterium]
MASSVGSRRRLLWLGAAGLGGTALLMRWDAAALPGSTGQSPQSSGTHGGVDDIERKYAQQRADMCGAGNAVGVGLKGEYYAEPDLKGPVLLSRVDPLIDFDNRFEWPAEQAAAAPRSVRWTGWIKPPLAGRYRFHADAPGLKVSVANQVVAGVGAADNAGVDMALGRFYPVTVEAQALDANHPGRWRFEWTAPHGMRYLVPTALLFVPVIPTRP